MQFIFGDKREANCLIRECLTCDWKKGKGKRNVSISPRMKYGHATARHLSMGKTNYALRVHISSEGWWSYSPFPSPLFQSQVGHFLIRQVASLLSPKLNCIHYDVTRQYVCRGLSSKKAESYYLVFPPFTFHQSIFASHRIQPISNPQTLWAF